MRRDVEEYVDTLKYVRAERLYAQEADLARREEGVDIAGLLDKEDREGRRYKGRLWELEREKRDARLFESDPEEAESRHRSAQAEIKAMNAARGYSHKAGPHSARAVMLHGEIHSTLQGYEKGDPLPQALSALPRYEREIAQDIITNGDRREKRRFYRLLPDAEKRVLGAYLGARDVPERKDLAEYFSRHTLPGTDWQGWREDFDLSAVRAIAAKEEKIALSDMSLFPRQIQEAEVLTENVPVPTVWGKTRDIRGTLEDLLSGRGVQHVRVDLQVSPSHHHSKFQVEADLHHDRTDEYAQQLR